MLLAHPDPGLEVAAPSAHQAAAHLHVSCPLPARVPPAHRRRAGLLEPLLPAASLGLALTVSPLTVKLSSRFWDDFSQHGELSRASPASLKPHIHKPSFNPSVPSSPSPGLPWCEGELSIRPTLKCCCTLLHWWIGCCEDAPREHAPDHGVDSLLGANGPRIAQAVVVWLFGVGKLTWLRTSSEQWRQG